MATQSFVDNEQLETSLQLLEPLKGFMTHPMENPRLALGLEYSNWLSSYLEQKLAKVEFWEESGPVALGSWARFELCPRSDIDLLFCGEMDAALKVAESVQKAGLKLRYRLPKDLNDWTVGVADFDVLSLINARGLTLQSGIQLAAQKDRILSQIPKNKKKLLKAMQLERKERNERYDSITNYLQPNIKFGKGGLRDIQQGLYIIELFQEKFLDAQATEKSLSQAKLYFLTLRHLMHLFGAHDILDSNVQQELQNWGGYKSIREFMRDFQNVLTEVSFLSDWILERAMASRTNIEEVESLQILKMSDALQRLKENPSILIQEKIKRSLDTQQSVVEKFTDSGAKANWRVFSKQFHPNSSAKFFKAIFRSQVIEYFVPELTRVRGLVQHDQYHRYTVGGHISIIVNLFAQAIENPTKIMGDLSTYFSSLDEEDLKILLWTCLFHDLAKGLQGDHSEQGEKLCRKQLSDWGAPNKILEEVPWMVKNHLLLSQAAFRHNPSSPSNWQDLYDRGVNKKRMLRLSCFTALDIQATNPDAWNSWKQGLLKQLLENMLSNRATKLLRIFRESQNHSESEADGILKRLTEDLVDEVPARELIEDYQRIKKSKKELPLLIVKGSQPGTLWIRFHRQEDLPGTFLHFVKLLYGSSCQVQQAHLRTHPNWGVYDWFCVQTNKKPAQLRKLFSAVDISKLNSPNVTFSQIKNLGLEDDLHLLSFTGLNQAGGLLRAAHDMHGLGLSVQWAKIHTWGQQIEFIFAVKKSVEFAGIFEKLRDLHPLVSS